ncbi:unnamed protein product, partial [marine sediment metagenome]
HAKRARREMLFPGGDGGEEAGPRFSDLAIDLRKLFKSTAYWNPKLEVGATGKVTVTVDLPDNITTYRIMAVVGDIEKRAGAAESRIVVKRPLIVQPVLPRFVYPDDVLTVEAIAFNGTKKEGEVQLAAEFEGLTLTAGQLSQKQRVKASGEGKFGFQVKVGGRGEVTIRFAGKLGEHADAVEVKLPILGPGTKRTLVASKSITGTHDVSIDIPAERLPGTA